MKGEAAGGLLIILGGLPGTGKTSIARELAHRLPAVHLRIDTIETALSNAPTAPEPIDDLGYRVAYAVAADNLRLDHTVIADSVNPIEITRSAWRDTALRTGTPFFEIEVICSDTRLHRQRVEQRISDIEGLKVPTWTKVENREYELWTTKHLTIDTARASLDESIEMICKALARYEASST